MEKDHDKRVPPFFTTKLKCWDYENERRIILYPTEPNILHYNKADLEGIVFGLRTRFRNASRICQIIEEKYVAEGHNVKLQKAELHKNTIQTLGIYDIDEYLNSLKERESMMASAVAKLPTSKPSND